jgi:hypothetical protein
VVVRFTVRGTHRGTFLGAEGTGRAVELTGIAVHRVVDRQIAETWVNWDTSASHSRSLWFCFRSRPWAIGKRRRAASNLGVHTDGTHPA